VRALRTVSKAVRFSDAYEQLEVDQLEMQRHL
jgi:hypothetical protein